MFSGCRALEPVDYFSITAVRTAGKGKFVQKMTGNQHAVVELIAVRIESGVMMLESFTGIHVNTSANYKTDAQAYLAPGAA